MTTYRTIIALSTALCAFGCSGAGFDVAESQRTDTDVQETDPAADTSPATDTRDAGKDSDPDSWIEDSHENHDSRETDTDAIDSGTIDSGSGTDSGIDTVIDTGTIDTGAATDSGVGAEDAIVCARWCVGTGSAPVGAPCSSASDCCSELCDFCAGGNCCKPQDTASSWCGGKEGTPEWCPGVGRCVP